MGNVDRRGFVDAVLILLLVVITWPLAEIMPTAGLDPSWMAGLHMAADLGLEFGRDISFTYGPLGFLSIPQFWTDETGAAALVWAGARQLAFCAALYLVACRGLPRAVAFIMVFLAAVVVPDQQLLVVTFVIAAVLVARELTVKQATAAAAAGGVLSAVQFLSKPPDGVATGALVAVALLALPGRARAASAVVGGFLVAAVALWLATGQPLGGIGPFLDQTKETMAGYGLAMGLDEPGRGWELVAAPVAFFLGGAFVWFGSPRSARSVTVGLWAVFMLYTWKSGLTRHYGDHAIQFFGGGAAVCLVAASSRVPGVLKATPVVLIALALGVVGSGAQDLVNPLEHSARAADAGAALARPATRDADTAARRAFMRSGYAVPGSMLARTRGRTVHVAPFSTAAVWAYRFNWRPVPAFQSYHAYTPALDRLNARAIDDAASGPDVVLTESVRGLDGRWAPWDTPRATVAHLCRFREVARTRRWLLTRRAAWSCGPVVPLGPPRSIRWGEEVAVPRPRDSRRMVLARVTGLEPYGWEIVRGLLNRPRARSAVLGGRPYRIVGSAEGAWLPVRSAATADFRPPFGAAPDAARLAFRREGSNPGRALTVQFAEMTLEAPPWARR